MPRDLTDLMQRATAVAPPEPHDAAAITRLAAHRQRRRTTTLAGGLALMVLVAGVAGYGLTRGHDSAPEPAGPYRYDQTVDVSSAVPATTLPGYHEVPWTIRSLQHFGMSSDLAPLATYQGVDPRGRLIVEDYPGGSGGQRRVRLYDAPGHAPHTVPEPPSPGFNSGKRIGWRPSLLNDGRLTWSSDLPIVRTAQQGFHVTDLQGGDDVFVHSGFTRGKGSFEGTPGQVLGDRYWFRVYDHNLPRFQGAE